MSDLRLRARSVSEIVDAAFQLYKRDALEYVLVAAVAYAPSIVAQLFFVRSLTSLASGRGVLFGPAWFIASILGIFAYALMSAVLSAFSSDIYLDRPTGLPEVVRMVLPRVFRVLGATILLGFVGALGFVPVMLGMGIGSMLLMFLGVLASIGWALYAFARFFAVLQVIVIEDRRIIESFVRSSVLSRGLKWHILLTLILIVVIFVMLSFATSMIGLALGPGGLIAIQALYTVFAYPLIGITQVVLYYDARIRNEGFDIEMMTGALQTPAPITP
ncbi:MAG TPA: hypothetical protein VGJ18_00450 [Gemmatimonadaceae bacterium]|jgi:hypothetical protein